jgi:hypothetical protein
MQARTKTCPRRQQGSAGAPPPPRHRHARIPPPGGRAAHMYFSCPASGCSATARCSVATASSAGPASASSAPSASSISRLCRPRPRHWHSSQSLPSSACATVKRGEELWRGRAGSSAIHGTAPEAVEPGSCGRTERLQRPPARPAARPGAAHRRTLPERARCVRQSRRQVPARAHLDRRASPARLGGGPR